MTPRLFAKIVTAGLDPAVHRNQAPGTGTMDPRIKSAGDGL